MRFIVITLLAFVATAGVGVAQNVAPMQPGQRLQLGPMLGERTVRQVMISESGGGIEIVYGMEPGPTQSHRVPRLENVNGMLEVVYDTRASDMPTGTGGTPRLVTQGGGMYSVEYGR